MEGQRGARAYFYNRPLEGEHEAKRSAPPVEFVATPSQPLTPRRAFLAELERRVAEEAKAKRVFLDELERRAQTSAAKGREVKYSYSDLQSLTVADLKKLAQDHGLTGYSKLAKDDLMRFIIERIGKVGGKGRGGALTRSQLRHLRLIRRGQRQIRKQLLKRPMRAFERAGLGLY